MALLSRHFLKSQRILIRFAKEREEEGRKEGRRRDGEHMGGGNVCSDGGGDEEEHLQGPRDDANGSRLHLHASHDSPHLRRGSPGTAAPGEALAPLAVHGGRWACSNMSARVM